MNIPAFHACTRFGLGAKPGDIRSISGDPRGWLKGQIENPFIPAEVKERYNGTRLIEEIVNNIFSKQIVTAEEKLKAGKEIYVNETHNRLLAHIRSPQPFIERLTMFWSNHFTVSVKKFLLAGIVHQYEVEAIRPHINGYFRDMLLSVYSHPAMLFYLDNIQSFGSESRSGISRNKGLNENLAREILELHTLGVNGGYSQDDVIALAKIITGRTLDRNRNEIIIKYKFQPQMHEPGDKIMLGKLFKENGEQESIDAFNFLSSHRSTARHISTKLARHFISDSPPESAVAALTKSFLASDGYLPAVTLTLINLKEAWENPLGKLKNPYEYAVSALRLTGIEPETPEQTIRGLYALGYQPFNASSPAGYDDSIENLSSPDAIIKRIKWGYRLAQRLPRETDPLQKAQEGLAEALSTSTKQAIERASSKTEGIALLLASPEFLRR